MTTPALKLDPHNANRGTDRGRRAVADSLAECGAGRSILVDRDGTVIAGNKTLEAAQALGLPVRVVESSGDELVVVQRTDLELDGEDQRARRLAYLDNRAAQLGLDWDTDQILADLEAGVDLSGLWDDAELDELLKRVSGTDGLTDPDDVPAVPEEATTQPGDLWLLGEHRLLCGDATVVTDMERLMAGVLAEMVWTDPPYGVAIGDKNKLLNAIGRSNRIEENLQNDTLNETDLTTMLRDAFAGAAACCLAGAAWYVAAPPGPLHVLFGLELKALGIWRQTLQWVKNNATFSPMGVDYHWRAEPIFYGWVPGAAHRYHGGRKQDTVWEIDRPTKSPDHPTMKPVELVARAVENSSLRGQIVLDPFLGSGTTLIAAEQTGRVCYGMEIDARYCDVIVRRWEEFTGKKAVLDGNEGHTQSS